MAPGSIHCVEHQAQDQDKADEGILPTVLTQMPQEHPSGQRGIAGTADHGLRADCVPSSFTHRISPDPVTGEQMTGPAHRRRGR